MIDISKEQLNKVIRRLESHLIDSNYRGWDVFDGLNSKLFNCTPFSKSRFCRLFWIQLFKNSPVNFRFLSIVPKSYNAKGLALLIRGYLNLYKIEGNTDYLKKAYMLADIIMSQREKDRDYFCCGYNFYWEARAFSVSAFTPNMIVSAFAGQSFLDLYDIDKNSEWLKYSEEIGEFIEKELILFESDNQICFGYIPGKDARVHNANLMGARLFARLFHYTGSEKYKKYANDSVNYSINAQYDNGAWPYGEKEHHQWIDNFHTGFNLVAINDVQKYIHVKTWQDEINKGLKYHLENHYLDNMTPKYFNNKLYPIDIHNFAQGIITLITFGYIDKAELLIRKCLELMWDDNKHYFYYQKTRCYTNKIDYIRWSQAWMFYALSKFLPKIFYV